MPTVAELAALVGGEYSTGHGSVTITGPAALAEARAGEISFFELSAIHRTGPSANAMPSAGIALGPASVSNNAKQG